MAHLEQKTSRVSVFRPKRWHHPFIQPHFHERFPISSYAAVTSKDLPRGKRSPWYFPSPKIRDAKKTGDLNKP